jgi:hypothetical protein
MPPPNVWRELIQTVKMAVKSLEAVSKGQSPLAVPVRLSKFENEDRENTPNTIEPNHSYKVAIRDFAPIDLYSKGNDPKVVVMDATADLNIIEKAIDRKLDLLTQHIEPEGSFVQIIDARVPKATLMHDQKTTERWVKRIENLGLELKDKHGSCLILSMLEFEKRLRAAFSGKVDREGIGFYHFYGQRGLSLEDFKASIIVGFPQPPRDSLYMDAAAIHRGDVLDESWEKVWHPYQDVNGSNDDGRILGSEVEVPADSKIRMLWENLSQGELYQSAFRIRGLQNDVPTYLITSAPVPDKYHFPVTLKVSPELWDGAAMASTDREYVMTIIRKLEERMGWISSCLMQALLEHRDELYKPIGLIGDNEFDKVPGWLNLLSKADEFQRVDARRVREIWAMLEAEGTLDPASITIRVRGKQGRPFADSVIGNLDKWFKDHQALIEYPGLIVQIDGSDILGLGSSPDSDSEASETSEHDENIEEILSGLG